MATLKAVRADITTLMLDAIVNASNGELRIGEGPNGAIHRAAGPGLAQECQRLGGCDVGEAKATKGYDLPAPWVIHTVAPMWRDGEHGESEALATCYRAALALADSLGVRSIAFPAVASGTDGFPIEQAAPIAVREVKAAVRGDTSVRDVVFCCQNTADKRVYEAVLCREC